MNIYKQRVMKRLFGDRKFNDIDRKEQLEINVNKRDQKIVEYITNMETRIKQLQSLCKKIEDEHYDGRYSNAKKTNKTIENTCNDIKKNTATLDYFLTQQVKDSEEYDKLNN